MKGYNWSSFSPVDNTGEQRSIFRSAYKNIRFALVPERTITLVESDAANLPGLAYRLYGDISLWRILLAFNGLNDPIQDIQAGVVLVLPTKASVTSYMSSQQGSRPNTITI